MKPTSLALGVLGGFLLLLLTTSCGGLGGLLKREQVFTAKEVLGVWQADYARYEVPDMPRLGQNIQGVETIVLTADGTFQQFFTGERNELTLGTWALESGNVLHLKGARIYIYGLEFVDSWIVGKGRAMVTDCHGKKTELNGSELILCVRPDRNAPGGVVLQHLEAGDPDAPITVTFYRASQDTGD